MAVHPDIRVPPAQVERLTYWASVPDDDISALRAAWDKTGGRPRNPADAHEQISDLIGDAAAEPLTALITLRTIARRHGWEISEAVDAVAAASDLDDEGSRSLTGRLMELIEAPAVITLSKWFDVVGAYERIYSFGQVFTDMRPIFEADPTEEPSAGIVAHALRIEFIHEGDFDALTIMMDGGELRRLRDALDRALEKDKTLKRFMMRAGVSAMGWGSDVEDE